MFSRELKSEIAKKIQDILRETQHPELPKGEIQFLLHVDGGESMSWANIRNNKPKNMTLFRGLIRNMTTLY